MEKKAEPPDVIYTENYDIHMYKDDDNYNNLYKKYYDVMKRISKRENIRSFDVDSFHYGDLDKHEFTEESKKDLLLFYSLNDLLLKRRTWLKYNSKKFNKNTYY